MSEFEDRFVERLAAWKVTVERSFQTESSLVAMGRRGDQHVVVKVVERKRDEWHAGGVLHAFRGYGMVRVLDYIDGAMLIERLDPGSPLTGLVLDGRDEEATEVVADVIGRMSPDAAPPGTPTAIDLGSSFMRYRTSGDTQIAGDLLEAAEWVYRELGATQQRIRLLHGDLQHYNVLLDSSRGWLAIDPKGIVGEVEYELGASLRNPMELPDLLSSPKIIERRVSQYTKALGVDARRIMEWAFSQAVLSAIWSFEDGYGIPPDSIPIRLAYALMPMIER